MSGAARELGGKSVGIFLRLQEDLNRGVFPPGSRLPRELDLCARFRTSRPTVRRALSRLVRDGRVTVRKRAGTFVRDAGAAVGTAPASRTVAVMEYYNEERLLAVQQAAMEQGLMLCAFSHASEHWNPAPQRQFLEQVRQERPRALLAFCTPTDPHVDTLLQAIDAAGTRVVHIEPYTPSLPEQSYCLPDHEGAGARAAALLLDCGYAPVYFTSISPAPYEQLLERGFAAALRETGIGYTPDRQCLHLPSPLDCSPEAQAAMQHTLDGLGSRQRPGFFCCSHNVAVRLQAHLAARGLCTPAHAGVITYSFTPVPPGIDVLVVDRLEIIRTCLARVSEPAWTGLRRLVMPHYCPGATLAPAGTPAAVAPRPRARTSAEAVASRRTYA